MNPFLLVKLLGVSVVISLLGSIVGAQTTRVLTAADYARAEKMMIYNTAPLVDNAAIRPNWLADNRFWYRRTNN